jgi:hypothetical protein
MTTLSIKRVLDHMLPELQYEFLCYFEPDELASELHHLSPQMVLQLVIQKKVSVADREQVQHLPSEMLIFLFKNGFMFSDALEISGLKFFGLQEDHRKKYRCKFCFHCRKRTSCDCGCRSRYSISALELELTWNNYTLAPYERSHMFKNKLVESTRFPMFRNFRANLHILNYNKFRFCAHCHHKMKEYHACFSTSCGTSMFCGMVRHHFICIGCLNDNFDEVE